MQEWIELAEPAFKAFGIELERDTAGKLVNKKIRDDYKKPWMKGMKTVDDLRNSIWALRFFEAGLNDQVIAAEVTATLKIADNILQYVDTTKAGAPLYQEPVIKTLLFELHNNRSSYLSIITKSTQKQLTAKSTLADLLVIMRVDIMALYKKNWKKHKNGNTEAEGEAKGGRLFDKVNNYFKGK